MKAVNESVFHRTSKLQPLFDFVASQVPAAASTSCIVSDMKKPGCGTGGLAVSHGFETMVFIGLSREGRVYPYVDHHSVVEVDAEVGGTVINSWAEEVLFTLLHEARHIYQFKRQMFDGEESVAAETDAERFAQKALKKWRRHVSQAQAKRAA